MRFISGEMKNGVMKDFEVTEIFVPEKGAFVKTKDMFAPLEEVYNQKTYNYEKGIEPFFPVEDLLR